MNELLNRLRTLLDGLSPRERLSLMAAGAAITVALLFVLVVQPLLGARERAAREVKVAENEREAMLRLRQEFDEVNGRLSRIERRIDSGPRGNIFTLLESIAQRTAVQVERMEPQAGATSERYRETKVEVVLKQVNLAQAIRYLHEVESADQQLSVKSLRLRTRKDKPEFLDVTFTVSAFEPTS